jgi:capsule biosynthesis phosphatase
MNKIIIDLDNTIAGPKRENYADCQPNRPVIAQMKAYKEMGFEIAIHTARNMRTYGGNVGRINVMTLPVITEWLDRYGVPYDEIWVGKPWCGPEGFYVDDRALRPDEFASMTPDEIRQLLAGPVSGNESGDVETTTS